MGALPPPGAPPPLAAASGSVLDDLLVRAILDTLEALVIVLDPTGRIVLFNRACQRSTGFSADEMCGRSLWDVLVLPEEAESVRKAFDDLAGAQGPGRHENHWRTRSGDALLIQWSNTAFPGPDGAVRFVIGTGIDVTERRRVERRLRERDESRRKLLHEVADALFVIDPGGTCLDVNARACELLGYARDELVGMNVLGLFAAADGSGEPAGFADIRPGEMVLIDQRLARKDGERLEAHVAVGRLDEGRVQLVVRDLTAQRRAEVALRRSERRLAEAQRAARLGSWDWDLATNAVSWSPELYRINGVDPGSFEVTQESALARVHPDDRDQVVAAFEDAIRTRMPLVYEHRGLRPDGSVINMHTTAEVIYSPDGTPVRVVGATRDVSEQKRLEEQLRQAQKLEAIGRLAGGVAHDFNNLLTAISGYSELVLHDHGHIPSLRRDVGGIKRAADHAAALTGQLLAFSRRQVLEPRVIDLGVVARELESMLRRLIGEHIEMRVRGVPALGRVRADPAQIEQILINLVLNARDAMPRGGTLTLELENVALGAGDPRLGESSARPGAFVMLSVTDTGHGMDAETSARVFEPFFTTKERGKGTGLGLATAYGIVTQSGGTITVQSRPGLGSTFVICLPAVSEPVDPPGAPALPSRGPQGSETVLLVEDEGIVRELVRGVLQTHGYRVIEAASGKAALEHSAAFPGVIHLVISDIVMPSMNGHAVVKRLQAERPGTRVLFISGYPDDALGSHGELPPGTAFLPKPFSPDLLARKVRAVLDEVRPEPRA